MARASGGRHDNAVRLEERGSPADRLAAAVIVAPERLIIDIKRRKQLSIGQVQHGLELDLQPVDGALRVKQHRLTLDQVVALSDRGRSIEAGVQGLDALGVPARASSVRRISGVVGKSMAPDRARPGVMFELGQPIEKNGIRLEPLRVQT